ncbi:unnamed protein product, partial [Larinioides sclopetarius]
MLGNPLRRRYVGQVRTIYLVYCSILVNAFVAFVDSFIVGKGGNYAVLRGSSLRLNCIPKVSEPQELREAGKTYVWTDEAGKELIDARYIKLNSGDLEIVNAHVGDSGIYKCTIQSSAKQVSPP